MDYTTAINGLHIVLGLLALAAIRKMLKEVRRRDEIHRETARHHAEAAPKAGNAPGRRFANRINRLRGV